MTRILAIDTATEACSAALWQDGQLLSRYEVAPRGHTDLILPMVAELLAEAELSLNQLDALAFGRGPGSFTGVRITLGVAQGLAFGADLPLLGVSNLQALAQGAYRVCGGESGGDFGGEIAADSDTKSGAKTALAAIDARMGEIYIGGFALRDGVMTSTDTEQVVMPSEWLAANSDKHWATGVGSGLVTYPELLARVGELCTALPYPEAQDLLPQALQLWQQGLGVAAADALPVYLRDKVTWQKLPGR
ncbi:tRNA (adenosine(37)-N6)-threonylcarbamoyltransferase complex dimerization subunit type 1 TsaB [Oceanisphaera profunda]|uniref:tRNA threonylcarbamoyladenosine biosynthesis protein TsaB n=1 Tax=Oceanisphaera profunda TaxID=1416627 RepID=A0A1Y0D160_9GAMM|nr:tRNA (adenosine(37)-N6)-threonylcarbamoyltransferase complex dimerization subunit type 1 TsaB [Oceanisphaera profunda]ART81259.1 tRNA (adenosine(37)-N6)-threonylcarbamoyltransferase complex dimerization subunit type 1 TsaB [Oceanisphaera profunda]